jgi:hypothetical protein
MGKVIRLSEDDLSRLVRKIISEAVIAESFDDVVNYLGITPNEKGNISFNYNPQTGLYLTNTKNNRNCILKITPPKTQPTQPVR